MRLALARVRHVAGIPSGLVAAAAATFYLLVNALTSWSAAEFGELGLWATVVVSAAVTTVLFVRWQHRFAASLRPARLDQPGTAKLAARRGLVVLVGLDSADPGTTFTRLLTTAARLEYLALIATPESEVRGVVPALLGPLMAVSGHAVAASRIRVWDRNEAEAMGDVEQSVTEAIDWMERHGLHASEIVVDVTKGRRSMAFGALIAADRADVEVQYLAAEWHHLDNTPRPGTEGFSVVSERWDGVGQDAARVDA
ncbi:hypothetical protein [Pengzhenrongella sp.]|jgi:hypothetical protein|uniref:hypothetical protein n=1 Tax=Pengzhenrongella sp. TaxID=2888820 RepID=UPI002F9380EC